jgi:hypothetical protein
MKRKLPKLATVQWEYELACPNSDNLLSIECKLRFDIEEGEPKTETSPGCTSYCHLYEVRCMAILLGEHKQWILREDAPDLFAFFDGYLLESHISPDHAHEICWGHLEAAGYFDEECRHDI